MHKSDDESEGVICLPQKFHFFLDLRSIVSQKHFAMMLVIISEKQLNYSFVSILFLRI